MQNKNKFQDFFTDEYGKLVNYVHKYLNTKTYGIDPEDVVQEIALNIFSKMGFNNPIENIAAYVYRAIRNRIIDYQRKDELAMPLSKLIDDDQQKEDLIFKDLIDEISDIEDEKERMEQKNRLFEAIQQLKPDQQAIIFETEFENKSFETLSDEWETPVGTLLSRKHRAILKLKAIMN